MAAFVKTNHELEYNLQTASDGDSEVSDDDFTNSLFDSESEVR